MFKKKSVIKEWFFSYILILLVPLAAIFINYNYNIKIIEKEIRQANELILNNLKDNVDSYLDAQRKMYFYFYKSEGFSNLVYSQNIDAEFYGEVREYCEQLNAYSNGNDKLNYWLYLEEEDYIVSGVTSCRSDVIYKRQKLLGVDLPTYEEWKIFLTGDYSNKFLVSENLSQEKGRNSLIFANSYSYFGERNANIFVALPVSYIQRLTVTLNDGTLFVIHFIDEDNDTEQQFLVMNSDESIEIPETLDQSKLTAEKGLFEIGDYMAISEPSDNKGVCYYLLIPKESFWEEAVQIRNVHLFSIVAAFLVGMILVVTLLRKNFLPVSSILQMIERENQEGNEFEQIRSAYGMIRNENHLMKHTMQSHQKSMCSSYLLSLFKGRSIRDRKREEEIGWNPPAQNSLLVLVGIDISTKENAEADDLSFFIIDNVLTELFDGESFYYIEDGRILFYLFAISEGRAENWKVAALEKINYLCDFMEEKMQMSLSVVISSTEKDIDRIKYLYQSVMETLEYKQIIGGNGIVTTDEWFEADEDSQRHVSQKVLIQALEAGNLDEACKASEALFVNAANVPFVVLRLRVLENFQVINDIYSKVITDSVKRMQIMEWLDDLLGAEDAHTLETQYYKMLEFAYARIAGQWKTENGGIVSMTKAFVEENYMDSSLNVSTIAAQIQKNPQYISKVFKSETGEGILDYINVLRIQKAKEILLTQQIPMEKVAEMVGYASVRTFRRSFAKVTGMTPSGYLESDKE